MRRVSAVFGLLFLTSLVLASYGHCWPMLASQLRHEAAAQTAHHHGAQPKQHHHPTEGFGQELSIPAVSAAVAAVDHPPFAKSFVPILLVVATIEVEGLDANARPQPRARAGPPAFAEFHARTGRLLI
jgi:hypothetical protein